MSEPFKVFSASGEFLGELKPPSDDDRFLGFLVSIFMWLLMIAAAIIFCIYIILPIGTLFATVVLLKDIVKHEFKLRILLLVILLWTVVLVVYIPTIKYINSSNNGESSQITNSEIPALWVSDSELEHLRDLYQSWGFNFDDLFNTAYQRALDEGWTSMWIGSTTNETQRLTFVKFESVWYPPFIPYP